MAYKKKAAAVIIDEIIIFTPLKIGTCNNYKKATRILEEFQFNYNFNIPLNK